jgi:hypothetical protein
MDQRPAAVKIIEFFTDTPLGEEILEGGGGGLIAGLSQVGTDKSPGQIALETATAMLGGIALGKAGRGIGAKLGKRIHKGELQNPTLQFIGRTFGNETTAKGLKQNALLGRELIKDELLSEASSRLAREAVSDPEFFMSRYGISAEQFQDYASRVQMGQRGAAVAKTLESMPPEQRKAISETLMKKLGPYEEVEQLIRGTAHNNFDENIARFMANREAIAGEIGEAAGGQYGEALGDMFSRITSGLDAPVQQVTGEHLGKAIGRFAGDEVGILGGMAVGSLLAQQLGMESPKDKKIRELEDRLARGG